MGDHSHRTKGPFRQSYLWVSDSTHSSAPAGAGIARCYAGVTAHEPIASFNVKRKSFRALQERAMRTITSSTIIKSLIFGVGIVMSASQALACGPTQQQIDQWVKQSISTDETVAAVGISAFRDMNQFGLNLICQAYDK